MSKARQAAELDYRLGALIRSTYIGWNTYPLEQRREYVRKFSDLLQQLAAVTGDSPATVTPPWTDNELDINGYDLVSMPSPLESAARVTERTLRQSGKLPKTLNAALVLRVGLDNVEHGKSLADLEAMHSQSRVAGERPRPSTHAQERDWVRRAESKAVFGW